VLILIGTIIYDLGSEQIRVGLKKSFFWVYDLSSNASLPIPVRPIKFAQCKFANRASLPSTNERVRSLGGGVGWVLG